MALNAATVHEIRTAGAVNSGGGFADLDPGTSVDYTQQDAAQLQLTDLATSGAGVTTLTSVVGGFTDAMVGSVIQIRSGTNVTAGFYQITVRTDTNTVTLDRAPDDGVGGISGGSGDLGGAFLITGSNVDLFFETMEPGNKSHMKAGTYTITSAISVAKDGTTTNPITVEGYNTSRGDAPVGSNRPLLAVAANSLQFDNYWAFFHLRVTITGAAGFRADTNALRYNVSVNNSSGSGNRVAMSALVGSLVVKCECQSENGYAISASASTVVIACYVHDSSIGVRVTGNTCRVIGSIIDTNTTGIDTGSSVEINVLHSTIYGNTTGISATTASSVVVMSNIFDANTTDAVWTTEQFTNLFDYNIWSGTPTNVTKGPNAITADPGLNDPANGDFTVGSGSNALDAGLQVGTDEGAVGDYKWNIGVDQDDNAAGGGGLLTHPGMTGGFRG